MGWKIYTKTGDKGNTSLLGGKKVAKSDSKIEAYGTVDELNAFLGHLRDQKEVEPRIGNQFYWVQEHLFSIGSLLAADKDFDGSSLPSIGTQEVKQLEAWIDKYDEELPQLKNFILPGGHPVVSLCHICRTVCRRAERSVEKLAQVEDLGDSILPFLNRLSDYFFIMSRKLAKDLGVPETPWVPK